MNTYAYAGGNAVSNKDPLGLDWFRPWFANYDFGRAGSKWGPWISPGEPIPAFVEDNLPAAHEFAKLHDAFVGKMTDMGAPDELVNIPSMAIVYNYAFSKEVVRSARETVVQAYRNVQGKFKQSNMCMPL
jgi:hypothetical protein